MALHSACCGRLVYIGINAREITLDDFILPGQGRGSVKQYLDSHLAQKQLQLVQHPGLIEAHPLRTKTNAQNPHSIPIQRSEHVVLDVWFWLMAVHVYAAMTHQPLQTHMVRASKPVPAAPPAVAAALLPSSVYCFAEQPLSHGGLHGRLKHHLTSIAAYEGESLHSFRRGMAQHQAAASQAHADIMRQMLLQTQQVFEAKYLASGRHNHGVKRARCTAGLE